MSADWGWPDAPKPIGVHSDSADFYEGHFLKVLLDRIARILEQVAILLPHPIHPDEILVTFST